MRRRGPVLRATVLLFLVLSFLLPSEAHSASRRRLVVRSGGAEAQWIRAHAIAIDSTDPAVPPDDLAPLLPHLAGVQVITLGEGTHFTHEFQTTYHRLTRLLAEQLGVRLFTFEGPWPDFRDLDDYLRTGAGDPVAMLADESWRFWDTEEMLALVLWARAWNQSHAQDDWIAFAGVDPAIPGRLRDDVVAYLAEVDPPAAAVAQTAYGCLPANGLAAPQQGCRAKLESVLADLTAKRASYEQAAGSRAFEGAHRSATMMLGAEYVASAAPDLRGFDNRRDEVMAANVLALRDAEAAGGIAVFRGHNGHASADGNERGDGYRFESVGRALRRTLGTGLFAIGSTSSRGTYLSPGKSLTLAVYPFPDPPTASWERFLEEAGYPTIVLPLRGVRPEWTDQKRPFFSVIGNHRAEDPAAYAPPMVLPAMYDAVVYIRETTPTRLLH